MGMKKLATESAEEIADIFVRNSLDVTRHEFVDLVEYALRNNTREEVAAIAAHMPPGLKELLPRKYLH
jgi:hypothetical protein